MYVHVIWCSKHLVGAVWFLSLVRDVGCALLLTMKGWGCLFSFTCRFSFSLVSWTFRPLIPSSTFFQLALRIKAHSQKSASCMKSAIWIKLPWPPCLRLWADFLGSPEKAGLHTECRTLYNELQININIFLIQDPRMQEWVQIWV